MRIVSSRIVALIIIAAAAITVVGTVPQSYAQQSHQLVFLGFNPTVPPADSLPLRQAFGYALDRDAIVKAVAPYLRLPPRPALRIQHPDLPGFTPSIRGYAYDAPRARGLLEQSGWSAPVTILAAPPTGEFVRALHSAIQTSLQNALATRVVLQPVANADVLVRAAKAGGAGAFLLTWVSDPGDFGYPSFALGLAYELVTDGEVRALLERKDVARVEQLLLDRALVVPVIYR